MNFLAEHVIAGLPPFVGVETRVLVEEAICE